MMNIVPISEMRDTSRMLELVKDDPVYITKNGAGAMVLMSMEMFNAYNRLMINSKLSAIYKDAMEHPEDNMDIDDFFESLK